MEATSPATQRECLECILEKSEKCYEFFMGKFELDQELFKYQMTQLVKMSYMTLLHLQEELKEDASKLDEKNISNLKPDVPIPLVEMVESADPVFTGEDQPEPVTESADPAAAGHGQLEAVYVEAALVRVGQQPGEGQNIALLFRAAFK